MAPQVATGRRRRRRCRHGPRSRRGPLPPPAQWGSSQPRPSGAASPPARSRSASPTISSPSSRPNSSGERPLAPGKMTVRNVVIPSSSSPGRPRTSRHNAAIDSGSSAGTPQRCRPVSISTWTRRRLPAATAASLSPRAAISLSTLTVIVQVRANSASRRHFWGRRPDRRRRDRGSRRQRRPRPRPPWRRPTPPLRPRVGGRRWPGPCGSWRGDETRRQRHRPPPASEGCWPP